MMGVQRFLSIMLLVGLITASFVLPGPARGAERRCFPETGQCIEGRFLEYWDQHGGLAVFGFPLGPAGLERSRDTGETYLTQWFERNRFELHPDNSPPYDVLLGRLGDDGLRKLYTLDWSAQPRGEQQASCLWFAETQHAVCDQGQGLGFKRYWESHGLEFDGRPGTSYAESLALFGLPLLEPRMETNSSGDTVLTQWFERVRLEWHPDKPDQYKVLLGLLGSEVREPVVHPINLGLPGRLSFRLTRQYSDTGDHRELYRMQGDGTNLQALAEIRAHLVHSTPDGRLSAVQPANTDSICLLGPDIATSCLPSDTGVTELRVAPSGRQVAYVSEGTAPGLHVLSFTTGVDTLLERAGDASRPAQPRWAPDSSRILYRLQFESRGLYSIAPDGSGRHQVAPETPASYDWSPNGQRILFSAGGDLWLANGDGSARRYIAAGVTMAAWAPNGAALAYIAEQAGQVDLYTVPSDGAPPRRLTDTPAVERSLLWSPQSDRIAYHMPETSEIFVLGAAGGTPLRMFDRLAEPAAWSPDGRYLAMATLPLCGNGHCLAGFKREIWVNSLDHWAPMIMLRHGDLSGTLGYLWIDIVHWG